MKTKRTIKIIYIICLITYFSPKTNAQCIANAGNDTTFCISQGFDTFYLGSSLSVWNGVPPYTYAWESNISIGNYPNNLHYTASNFLSDTTVANPYFALVLPSSITATFHLYVIDSIGNTCNDSVKVSFCGYTMISHIPININQGDSANLYSSISADCMPITCSWHPYNNISDIYDCTPLVWPDTTTIYSVLITDASGCQYVDICEVIVSQTNIEDNSKNYYDLIIFPNPSSKYIDIVGLDQSIQSYIQIFDIYGRLLIEKEIYGQNNRISILDLPNGVNYLKVNYGNHFYVKKFLKY